MCFLRAHSKLEREVEFYAALMFFVCYSFFFRIYTQMVSGSAATNDEPEKKIEAEEESNEVKSISSNNEGEKEKEMEAAKLKDSSKIDGLRRSKRFAKEPLPVQDHVKDTKSKGKGKGNKRV